MPDLLYPVAKRALDVVGSSAVLLATLPVTVPVAVAVKCSGPGPVLFRQRRAGRGGVPFHMFKFRSMRPGDAAQQAGQSDFDPTQWHDGVPDDFVYKTSSASDDRITAVGQFLRKTSLDELPQLLNVLNGSMSLVGPRPEVMPIVERYNAEQRRRLEVKPGITGLAQTRGRANLTHGEKIALDLEYVKKRSLRLDLALLWETAKTVLTREGSV